MNQKLIQPIRIQRSRQHKQISPNALKIKYVGRPSKFGNPFRVEEIGKKIWGVLDGIDIPLKTFSNKKDAINYCIKLFESHIKDKDLSELKGKNLSCWCKIGEPCHVDFLLKLANS